MWAPILLDIFFLLVDFEYLYYSPKTWLWEIIISMSTRILARILTSVRKSRCSLRPPFSGLLLCENSRDSARTHTVRCYREIRQSETSKGRRAWGEMQGSQAPASKSSLPVEPRGTHLIPRAACVGITTCEKCYLPGKLLRDSASGVFIRGWSRRQPLLGRHQNDRLPEGKLVFRVEHTVCTNVLGTVSHS